jgi:predicted short-subunit dehydrogenase-like oxidoreductase (DUF2520 family)
MKSFANPDVAAATFAGTYCGIEGDADATEVLTAAFRSIEAEVLSIDPRYKMIYHAGAVIVSNYVVALVETGLRCYERAGIDRVTAMKVIERFLRAAVENITKMGTVSALTGPIARGDDQLVVREMAALSNWDPQIAELYKVTGRIAAELSALQGTASADALRRISAALGTAAREGMV